MNRKDLINYKNNKLWIEDRKEQIQQEYEKIQKLTATYGNNLGGGSSKVQDKLAENLSILLDNKKELLDYMINQERKMNEILLVINNMEQPYKNIITFVYIDGKTLVEVANIMHYSYREICRKHGTALKKYDEI